MDEGFCFLCLFVKIAHNISPLEDAILSKTQLKKAALTEITIK
jgi:hypothetical protein